MENNKALASADPTGYFTFTLYTFCFAAIWLKWIPMECANMVGVLLLFSGVPYMIVALNALKRGDGFGGNLFFVFAISFALVGGSMPLANYVFTQLGWPIDNRIFGIVWLCMDMFLIMAMPAFFHGPWHGLLMGFASCIQLAIAAWLNFGLAHPLWIESLNGILLIIMGLCAFFNCTQGFLAMAGINIPTPKPLFPIKDAAKNKEL
ncbi:MAG: hypothetical protein VB021_08450 [Oscillospiraceae bacterium]|nr:hypothetical protein [Oscillospiraceae bacterium]